MARRRSGSNLSSLSRRSIMGVKSMPVRLNGAMSVFLILFLIVAFSSSDMKWLQHGPQWLN